MSDKKSLKNIYSSTTKRQKIQLKNDESLTKHFSKEDIQIEIKNRA